MILSFVVVVHLVATLLMLQIHLPVTHEITDEFCYFSTFHQLRTSLEIGGLQAALEYLREPNSHYSYLAHYPLAILSLASNDPERAARGANVIYFILLLVGVYGIGRRCHSRGAGLLAASLVSLMPAVYGGWRTLGLDFPAMCVTPPAILMLMRCQGFCRLGASMTFGLVAGLAILIKVQCAFFIVPPAAYVLGSHLAASLRTSHTPQIKRTLFNAGACVLVVALVTMVWWAGRLGDVAGRLLSHTTGEGMLAFEGDVSLWGGLFFYVTSLPTMVSNLMTLALVLLFVPFLRGSRHRRELLLWLVIPFLLHVVLKVRNVRYLFPLAPVIALIISVGLCSLRPLLLRNIAAAVTGVGAVALWLICSFSGVRCDGASIRPMRWYHEMMSGRVPRVRSFFLSCGDPVFVALICEPTGSRQMENAGKMVRWMLQGKDQDPALVYFNLGDSQIAAAMLKHSPSLRLSYYGSQIRHYAAPRQWSRFVLLPVDCPTELIRLLTSRRPTLSLPDQGLTNAKQLRWYHLIRLRPNDRWPPLDATRFGDALEDLVDSSVFDERATDVSGEPK